MALRQALTVSSLVTATVGQWQNPMEGRRPNCSLMFCESCFTCWLVCLRESLGRRMSVSRSFNAWQEQSRVSTELIFSRGSWAKETSRMPNCSSLCHVFWSSRITGGLEEQRGVAPFGLRMPHHRGCMAPVFLLQQGGVGRSQVFPGEFPQRVRKKKLYALSAVLPV